MVVEWTSIFLVLILLLISLCIIKLIASKVEINAEIKRKLFHMSMGLVMLTFPYIFKTVLSVGVLGIIALIVLMILKHSKLKDTIGTVLYGVDRNSLGEIFFVISVFVIFYLSKGNKVLYSIPILVLTFADSVAALIGKNYGKKNIAKLNEDAKSIEGSFMFFMVAFMATLVPLLLFTTVGREETLIISTIIGFNVALIEMISHTGNDNLLIPLTTYAFLSTHINMSLEILRNNLIILGVIFILATIANRIKTWSKLALVEAMVVGYLTVTLYGLYALIPPMMLFFTSMIFPKLRESEKNIVYDARIIETNVVLGVAICVIVAITGMKQELFMIYALVYSMHLTVNTFVRFKYFVKLRESASLISGFLKGLVFVFLPSLMIQKKVFEVVPTNSILNLMVIMIFISGIIIKIKKRNVEKEETSIRNGYMHAKIVLVLTLITYVIQYFKVL